MFTSQCSTKFFRHFCLFFFGILSFWWPLLLAFTLCFTRWDISFPTNILIPNVKDIPGFIPSPDHYVYFDGPWTSLVKTITMFVGELEFSDIPIDPSSGLSCISFAFLVVFVFFIVVILMNLLNGLAVSDTGIIMEKAEIVSYTTRLREYFTSNVITTIVTGLRPSHIWKVFSSEIHLISSLNGPRSHSFR